MNTKDVVNRIVKHASCRFPLASTREHRSQPVLILPIVHWISIAFGHFYKYRNCTRLIHLMQFLRLLNYVDVAQHQSLTQRPLRTLCCVFSPSHHQARTCKCGEDSTKKVNEVGTRTAGSGEFDARNIIIS